MSRSRISNQILINRSTRSKLLQKHNLPNAGHSVNQSLTERLEVEKESVQMESMREREREIERERVREREKRRTEKSKNIMVGSDKA